MALALPDTYNAATTFVDENIAQGRGGKVAIYYQDQKITYQQVFEQVNRTGNALRNLGIEIENRVLVILPDSPEFAYSFFGAIKIGAVAVPTNPWMFAKDYEYLINDSRARAIVVHESVLPEIEKIWDRTPFLKHVLVVGTAKGKAHSYENLIAKASDKLEAEKTTKDDVCFWGYTSGSTGNPKGAVHLQHDMITISDLFVKPVLKMTENDLCFSASKMFLYGLGNSLYFPFRFGASTVLWPEKPEPEKILQVIEKYKPTFFFSVPTLFARFLRIEKKYDFSSLRICLRPANHCRRRFSTNGKSARVSSSWTWSVPPKRPMIFLPIDPGGRKPGAAAKSLPPSKQRSLTMRGKKYRSARSAI